MGFFWRPTSCPWPMSLLALQISMPKIVVEQPRSKVRLVATLFKFVQLKLALDFALSIDTNTHTWLLHVPLLFAYLPETPIAGIVSVLCLLSRSINDRAVPFGCEIYPKRKRVYLFPVTPRLLAKPIKAGDNVCLLAVFVRDNK